jgi:alkaline phosphatase D
MPDAPKPPPATPFAHAVASFDPTADAVLLWTSVDAPPGATVGWSVTRTPGGAPLRQGTAVVPADGSGCVTVDVDGLDPATTYHYWFDLDGVLSPLGRTRTLPDGPVGRYTLAVVCCADRSMGALDTYRVIAVDEVDVVLHLGDYLYEEAKGPYPVDPPGTCSTLDDYRRRHAHIRLDQDLQALHLRHPMIFVWDDHDVADNAWRHGAKGHDPDEHGPWEDRLAAAARARDEWLPARRRDPENRLAMWRSFALGDLAELVVLDTRIPGRDVQVGDPGAPPIDDPERALLEPAQRAWMGERVRDRTRPWCLLASQVPVADLELPVPAGGGLGHLLPSGYDVIDGEIMCTDLWEGYPEERRALCRAIEDRGGGTVVVSGDVHSNWVTRVLGADHEGTVAAEFVVTSVSSTPMGDQLPPGWRTEAERIAAGVPRTLWQDLEHHGYLRLEVTRDAVRADYLAVDARDDDGEPRVERQAVFVVDGSLPPVLRPLDPEEAPAVVPRPGLPVHHLPPPEPLPRPRPARRWGRVGVLAAVVVVALAVAVQAHRSGGRGAPVAPAALHRIVRRHRR